MTRRILIALAAAALTAAAADKNSSIAPEAARKLESLKLRVDDLRHHHPYGGRDPGVEGTVVNEADQAYTNIVLTIELEDSKGNTVDTVKARRRVPLAPGEQWRFRVVYPSVSPKRRVLTDVAVQTTQKETTPSDKP